MNAYLSDARLARLAESARRKLELAEAVRRATAAGRAS